MTVRLNPLLIYTLVNSAKWSEKLPLANVSSVYLQVKMRDLIRTAADIIDLGVEDVSDSCLSGRKHFKSRKRVLGAWQQRTAKLF